MSLRSTSHAADHRASGRGARSRPRALRCGCSSTDRRSIDAIGSLLTVTAIEPLALTAVDGDWEEWRDARCRSALDAAAGLRNEPVPHPADQAPALWTRADVTPGDNFLDATRHHMTQPQ